MNREKDIAIVGMACVFPRAANLTQFWSNLANGVDAIDEPPPGRWSTCRNFTLPQGHEAFLPCNRGGFLPCDVPFDPLPFGVQPNLVRHGDVILFKALFAVIVFPCWLAVELFDRATYSLTKRTQIPFPRHTTLGGNAR